MFHMVKGQLEKGSAAPQRFCRTLGAKPSFAGPANSSPRIENVMLLNRMANIDLFRQ